MESFYSAIGQANLLYGIEMNEDDALDVALIAWNKIGNKLCRLYKYCTKIDCETLAVKLPCNCDELEAVTYGFEDWEHTTNTTPNGDWNSHFTEHYIEGRKINTNPFYISGKYAQYEQVGDTLYFDKNYGSVNILYKGVLMDGEGLPQLNEKEVDAIACYLAYTKKFKESLITHNQAILQEAQLLEQKWNKLCDAARVKYLNQNDFDRILDAHSNFNRKSYGKSYKPLR